jgi:acetyl-CoA C-acetyltransferase
MKDVFVVESLRTPFGAFGGALSDVDAPQLAATVIKALLVKASVDAEAVDEVIIGQVLSGGVGQAPARMASRLAGLPDATPAMTINKVCGSGLKALMLAAGSIRLGEAELALAGGMENMSTAPYLLKKGRFGYRMGTGEVSDLLVHDGLTDPYSGRHMGELAEATIRKYEVTREEQDRFAWSSYRFAQQAVRSGLFADEISPVVKKDRKGETTVAVDEEPFRVDIGNLSELRPAFGKEGTITAGNASTISDGAALTLLAGEEAVRKYELVPRARVVAYATNSIRPDDFAEAPVGAIRKVCQAAGLDLSEIGLLEINEAFAAVPLVAMKALNIDRNRVNVNGGAVAIGHPLGASGGRLTATLVRELHRRNARYGLATLCIGGGEAVAAIFERV